MNRTDTTEHRCAVLAAALVLGQVAIMVAGVTAPWGIAAVAPVAVGLALVPWAPAGLRGNPLAMTLLVLPIGVTALTLVMVAVGGLQIPFDRISAGVVLVGFAAAGWLGAARATPAQPEPDAEPSPWWAWAGAALVVALGVGSALLVNHSLPATGNDWGKYLLYADEIRDHGHTLIHNPYWLLGQPFREDPGVPALYATMLVISGGTAGGLGWGIVFLVGLFSLAMTGTLIALFGARAGILGGLAVSIAPAISDMSAWHGAANMLGLVAMPFSLLAATMLLRGARDPARWAGLLGLGIVGVLCAHRLTALMTIAALVIAGLVALVFERRRTLSALGRVAIAVVAIGVLPAVDLYRRSRQSGGVADYRRYLTTKIEWSQVVKDITYPIGILFVLALVVMLVRRRRDPASWVAVSVSLVTVGYAYSWVFHFPGFYARATYFMPIALGLVIAAGVASVRLRWALPVTGIALAIALFPAPKSMRDTGNFYRFVDRPSLRGFDVLASRRKPGEVVIADHCTTFIAPWVLKAPTLGALRDDEIGPATELTRVRQARSILAGTARGRTLAEKLDARWLVINPNCPGRVQQPPGYAKPVYVSTRLVVFQLDPEATNAR